NPRNASFYRRARRARREFLVFFSPRSPRSRRSTRLLALPRFVDRARSAADRRSNERALLAAEDRADAGAGASGAADHESGFLPVAARLLPHPRRRRRSALGIGLVRRHRTRLVGYRGSHGTVTVRRDGVQAFGDGGAGHFPNRRALARFAPNLQHRRRGRIRLVWQIDALVR